MKTESRLGESVPDLLCVKVPAVAAALAPGVLLPRFGCATVPFCVPDTPRGTKEAL
jgi:hypothetical protein